MFSELARHILEKLQIDEQASGVYADRWIEPTGGRILSICPANEQPLAHVLTASREDYELVIESSLTAQAQWRTIPAPRRGEIVRQIGWALRQHKSDLAMLVTLETGKIVTEAEGEVQEMIDICDYAVGLSRQLYGLTMPSERPAHRLFEQWHPLGLVGVITAFNFPVAVWAWNAAIALVCGDAVIWKPSPRTPLTAIAVQRIVADVLRQNQMPAVAALCVDETKEVGQWMADDRRLPLISATGSCTMGRHLSEAVARRLGRSLLELGGNNAVIVTASANQPLALRAVLFAAVGTAGQRCTTLRRLIIHETIADEFLARLVAAYDRIRIGDPWDRQNLLGPLINQGAVDAMQKALQLAARDGAKIRCGGTRLDRSGFFVRPAIVEATPGLPVLREETFAPILYVLRYDSLDEAIAWHNDVDQGLSSAIFSDRFADVEHFLSVNGSDCGIANVNIGTSGAEIGGAFGGEKDTGGGREAGSDSWKAYMRRQTCTLNYGDSLPLAQGVEFDL